MNYIKNKNDLSLTAIIFGSIGFVLLIGVVAFHKPINSQFMLAEDIESVEVISSKTKQNPVPEEVIQEIIKDERNILGYIPQYLDTEPLTPAMKFLYTMNVSDLFLTQE